jgi:class 3 adenylate cyclase
LAVSLGLGRSDVLRLKEKISRLFGQYVDRSVRDEIIRTEKGLSRKQPVCILFSDIRDFTPTSEKHSPEAVTGMLNLYFTRWDTIIAKRCGVVDKFIGDAIMVLFGLSGKDDGCNAAVDCAREMLGALDSVKRDLTAAGLPVIKDIGIGINFGECIVGDIRSENRKNWTVIGDNVNLASRLESSSKTLGRRLVISEQVFRRLSASNQGYFDFLGRAAVKGKTEGIPAYGIAP